MAQDIKRKKANAKRRHKRRVRALVWSIITVLILGVSGFLCKQFFMDNDTAPTSPVSGDLVEIHFIDVGQGDAILVRTAAGDVLIDAGDNSAEEELKRYLDDCRVDDLEYAVFTHPDADHIGGADVVLNHYDVERVIRPDHDVETKVYLTMVDLIKAEGAEDIRAEVGGTFMVGEVKFTMLAPIGDIYSSRNDYSVVLRMDYGDTSVLFTGDAELKSEDEMLARYGAKAGGLLDCDIIKVGHHGSDSSSGEGFLKAVTPDFAIISCGENNRYNHPDPEILERYRDMKIPVLCTDEEGDIVFVTTGGEPERKAA